MEQEEFSAGYGGERVDVGAISEGGAIADAGTQTEQAGDDATQLLGIARIDETQNSDLAGSSPPRPAPDGRDASENAASDPRSDRVNAPTKLLSRNALPNQVTVAAPAVRRRISSQLDSLIAREVKALREDLSAASMTDDARQILLTEQVPATAEADTVAELKSALIDLDGDRFERSAKKIDIPAGVLDENLKRIKLSRTLQELQELVRKSGSAEDVDAFTRRFELVKDETGLDNDDQSRLTDSVNGIVGTLRIRKEIGVEIDTASGTLVPAPEGEVAVVYYPPLAPSGKPFLIGERILAIGTATSGDPVVSQFEASQLLGMPAIEGRPAEELSAERAHEPQHDGPMVLSFRDRDLSVKYRLNNVDYTIQPGQSQPLSKLQTWTIDFERADGSRVRYTLEDKAYAFTNDNGVLDLRAQTFSTTIQHPAATGTFMIVVDDEDVAIPPGQALTISSAYPIVVSFDRGNGEVQAYRRLFTGTYSTSTGAAGWELLKIAESDQATTEGTGEASD